jgi:hypothetical protein
MNTKRKILLEIEGNQHVRLKIAAACEHKSVSCLIREAIDIVIEKHGVNFTTGGNKHAGVD